jgi:hypothetical protein
MAAVTSLFETFLTRGDADLLLFGDGEKFERGE